MLRNIAKRNSLGRLKGPKPDRSVLAVIAYVESQLETFSQKVMEKTLENEKGLTQTLCILLNKNLRKHPFRFEKEFMEIPERGDSPTVDIGVVTTRESGIYIHSKWFASEEAFFTIEAKRLDTITPERKKEYLLGRWKNDKYIDCGGVERFKKGIHGSKLQYSALIGYVQKHDFNYWHNTINLWIDEMINGNVSSDSIWEESDKLIEVHQSLKFAKFLSNNVRLKGTIQLFHLWVNLVK